MQGYFFGREDPEVRHAYFEDWEQRQKGIQEYSGGGGGWGGIVRFQRGGCEGRAQGGDSINPQKPFEMEETPNPEDIDAAFLWAVEMR